jgi:hypothetical protein
MRCENYLLDAGSLSCNPPAAFFRGRQMDGEQGSRRMSRQLENILYDACQWAIIGADGHVLGFAPSLREALDGEVKFGALVSALTRHPLENITVLPDQIARPRKIVAGLETPAIRTSAWDDPADRLPH